MHPWRWAIILAASTPMFILLGWLFFDTWRGFLRDIGLAAWADECDARSYEDEARNEEDLAGFKVIGFLILCACTVFGMHLLATFLGL
jgi:hypothetical protein